MKISVDVALTKESCDAPSIFVAAHTALGKLVSLDGLHFSVVSVEPAVSPAKTPVDIAIHPIIDVASAYTLTLHGSGVCARDLVNRFIHTVD